MHSGPDRSVASINKSSQYVGTTAGDGKMLVEMVHVELRINVQRSSMCVPASCSDGG